MTLWQDQSSRGPRSGATLDSARAAGTPQDGRPLSRREAREAERRAAEALAEGRVHPSGVVDFGAHDFGGDFDSDQEIGARDTADIWAALSRRADAPQPPAAEAPEGELSRFRSGVPESPRGAVAPAQPVQSATSGELMDRVREAVLRRERDEEPVLPTVRVPVQPPQRPLTRRELRARQAAETTEDGMPAAWFSDAGAGATPSGQVPAAFAGYTDEPTVAIPALDRAALEAQTPMTAPVNLPQFFAEPQGDDALTFSSPIPLVSAEPHPEEAEEEPAFLEPRSSRSAFRTPGAFQPPAPTPPPVAPPAAFQAPAAFTQPPAAYTPEQVGPPSEVTDLAGFEALIRAARGGQVPTPPQPMPRQVQQPLPTLPWQDDEDEAQQDYTGLLGRPVTGSNGSPNALILPNDPQPDLTQAVNSTGDIFVTGSHHLPRSLAQTGATADHYDSVDIDRLFEASQEEPAAGVAPVRASKAISGTGSTRSIIGARRARGNVLPTVLALIAGAMAIGVVALLVGSWVLKLF